MAGLNYGYTYNSKKGIRTDRETGVIYNDKRNKWMVRIKKKNGHVSTLAQFDNKEDAEKCYNSAVENVL